MSIYCINPSCPERENPDDKDTCRACGSPLLHQGKYKLLYPLRSLREGDRVEIFKAHDQQNPSDEKVIKVITFPLEKFIQLQRREAHVLKYLFHPGIPNSDLDCQFIVELENSSELHCLVTEYIPGEDLKSWLEREGPVNQSKAFDWLNQLAEILNALHSFRFFHRDIKPQNIILRPDGKLVLIDFGAARDVSESYLTKLSPNSEQSNLSDSSSELTTFFSPGYASPEAMNGRAIPQSDFFSLGRTIVHLTTGIHPNDLPHDNQQTALLWRDKAPQIEKPFADYLDRLMTADILQRPYNTSSLLRDLKHLPKKLNKHRFLNSKKTRFLALIVLTALFITVIWGGRHIATQQFESTGRTQLDAGKREKAQEAYRVAIKIDGKNYKAYNGLAVICLEEGDVDCALENYALELKHRPKDTKWLGYANLGLAYDIANDRKNARTHYKQAIQLSHSSEANPINNLARINLLEGKADVAMQSLLPLLKKDIDSLDLISVYKNLGWAALELQQYQVAQSYLAKAIETQDTLPQEEQDKLISPADPYCLLLRAEDGLGKLNKNTRRNCLLLNTESAEAKVWQIEYLDRVE